jgi:putative oxidoreductase
MQSCNGISHYCWFWSIIANPIFSAAEFTHRQEKETPMIDTRTAPYAALLLRLGLGVMFVAHALLKLLVFSLPGTVQFFESQGFPGFTAYLVVAAELFGGGALVLGIYVRPVSAGLIPVLLGAIWVHAGNGWLFTVPNGGWEYPAFLTLATVVQLLLGAGAHAVNVKVPSLAAVERAA